MHEKAHFEYDKKEIAWLTLRDPALGEAISEIGPLRRAVTPNLFTALVHSIVGQQISTKAQATIWGRLEERFSPLTPELLGSAPPEQIQACGITMRKALYIQEIADSISNGSLDLQELEAMPDAEVSARLSQLRGVGVWTAEMLMIFSMRRPDILSRDDLAILRGLRMLYRHRKITPALFEKYRRRYSPYATTASLYLWAIAGGALPGLTDPAKKQTGAGSRKQGKK